MITKRFKSFLLALGLLCSLASADTLNVPGDYGKIMDAINNAQTGDTILVAPGYYLENVDFLGKDISLISSDGPEVTTINGLNKGSVVKFISNETSASLLQGFTLTGGSGTYDNTYGEVGGGIYGLKASPRIVGNIITANDCHQRGGGIFLNRGTPMILDNTISGNYARVGGGAYLINSQDPEVSGNLFTDNSSYDYAGGLLLSAASTCIVKNNNFIANWGTGDLFGGGIYIHDTSGIIRNNQFEGHYSLTNGGALFIEQCINVDVIDNQCIGNTCLYQGGAVVIYESNLITLEGNLISENTSQMDGGGIWISLSSEVTLNRNIIKNNQVTGAGGGVINYFSSMYWNGNTFEGNTATSMGGAVCAISIYFSLKNNRIFNNTGERGGAVYLVNGTAHFANNVIAYNTSRDSGGGIEIASNGSTFELFMENDVIYGNKVSSPTGLGSGLFSDNATDMEIYNTVFWGNKSADGAQIEVSPNAPLLNHCNVQGGFPGTGNIDADPMFIDVEECDFHIAYDSPCINAGISNYSELPEMDFEGDPRIAFDEVDIGADEFYTHLYCTGDAQPGGNVEIHLVGLPGTQPLALFLGSGQLTDPLQTKWGDFFLEPPFVMFGPLGTIPASGSMALPPVTIPLDPPAPYTVPLQALIGLEADSLSNVFELKII